MTEAEALSKMKRDCRLLPDIFTDVDLVAFLAENLVGTVYNVRAAIYAALTSAATTEWNSMGRGSVTMTRTDFMRIRRQYATAGTVESVRVTELLQ